MFVLSICVFHSGFYWKKKSNHCFYFIDFSLKTFVNCLFFSSVFFIILFTVQKKTRNKHIERTLKYAMGNIVVQIQWKWAIYLELPVDVWQLYWCLFAYASMLFERENVVSKVSFPTYSLLCKWISTIFPLGYIFIQDIIFSCYFVNKAISKKEQCFKENIAWENGSINLVLQIKKF